MAAARATAPVFDGKPYSAEVLPATVGRSSAVLAGSAALFAACVPGLPDWWSTASLDPGACSVPLLTMAASSALVAAGWSACGTDLHPITAKARGVTPPKSYTFQLLGLSAPLLASAAVASGWQPLPVAGSGVELAHAVLPFALWSIDVRLLRWLNPHVSWSEESVSLPANYAAEHGDSPVGAVLACVGVVAFEVYVQQLLAAPLTLGGCPVLGSASLIALTAGLLNHALANGLLNGLLCAEFYWTVSLMFGLSNSVLPVGIYHHLMYSMPTFVTRYQLAVDEAPSPAAHTLLLHATLAAWHCAAFAAVARLAPPAMPLLAPLDGPSVPAGTAAWAGLACVGLFGFAAASIASDYARGEEAA